MTEGCWSISQLEVDYIQDEEETQRVYFTGGAIEGFKIVNTSKKEINLLAVDGGFMAKDTCKKCDGVVFDDEELCFFELKLNMTSGSKKKKVKNFKTAIEQLESTITFFKNNIDFCALNLEAYLCMKDNSYPKSTASRTQKRVAFLNKNSIPLFDKNKKEFKK